MSYSIAFYGRRFKGVSIVIRQVKKYAILGIVLVILFSMNLFHLKQTLLYLHIEQIDFSQFTRFFYLNKEYSILIENDYLSLFRMSIFYLFIFIFLKEIMALISETSNYYSMLIHRYNGSKKYLLSIIVRYIHSIAFTTLLCGVIQLLVYCVFTLLYSMNLEINGLIEFILYFLKLNLLFCFIYCISDLCDVLNRGHIAYIAISIIVSITILLEHFFPFNLFYFSDTITSIIQSLLFIILIFGTLLFHSYTIERADIL